MHLQARHRRWLSRGAAVLALVSLCGCVQPPAYRAATSVTPVTPGGARIWFYRDYEPSITLNNANVSLNGALTVSLPADGSAMYRDIAPGRYHVTVGSFGKDVNQEGDIDIGPGQEGFVKILAADQWEGGGDTFQFKRDTFYVSVVPPQIARGEMVNHPVNGG